MDSSIRILSLVLLLSLAACVTKPTPVVESENPLRLAPDHATLSVADIEREKNWCVNTLGFRALEKVDIDADHKAYHVVIPGYRLDLIWERGSSHTPRKSGLQEQGWVHVVFHAPDLASLEADYQKLVAMKANVRADKDPSGHVRRIQIYDPEGNEFEIVLAMPTS